MLIRAPKHTSKLVFVAVLGLLPVVLTSCSHEPASSPITPAPTNSPVPTPGFDGNLTVYVVASPNSSVQGDANGLVPLTVKVDPGSRDLAKEALDALASSKQSPLPQGTSVLGVVIDQSTGLATVNFSREFKDKFSGGDTREAQVLNSVLQTLGQFPSVQNVQFLVEGQKIDSLGGTQDLTDPLPTIKGATEASAGI